ncbi:MAG: universal stress protein [Armatimonadetes bacterium]|nr:universal stress protein [Armatimonadota bacterium]
MRILFATDGSDSNLAAARFLLRLGHHPNVHVHLLIAPDGSQHDDGTFALNRTKEAIGDFAGNFTRAAFRADTTSEIADRILVESEIAGASLIVVGARGHSAIARFLLGSVAEAVARHASVPVLVARSPEPIAVEPLAPLTEIIVGIDGSTGATDAAMFAATVLPLPPGCTVRLVMVLPKADKIAPPETPTGASAENHDRHDAPMHHAEAVLSDLRWELEARGTKVATETVCGDPSTELIAVAERERAGLIVIGSRGLSGVERLFIGSVSDRLLWHAPCSVLICRPSSGDNEGEGVHT